MLNNYLWGLPGGPMVKFCASNERGTGLIPGQGTKILHAKQHSQKKKTKIVILICGIKNNWTDLFKMEYKLDHVSPGFESFNDFPLG